MAKEKSKKGIDRREFLSNGLRLSLALGLGGVGAVMAAKSFGEEMVWQLDASKCVQCGRCAT